MVEPLFLRACHGLDTERVPIWIMRQAGRYLPEYRAVRERHGFMEMCHVPELASEVTLQPIREFGFDAAIIFSDILLPLEAMGVDVEFVEGKGPQLNPKMDSRSTIDALPIPDFQPDSCFLGKAISLTRANLDEDKALIGFAGAPWTMACYAVEGMGSRDYAIIKSLMNTEPETLHALLEKLTETTIRWLRMQLAAGADVFQVFDSWADALSPSDYREFAAPYLKRIFSELRTIGKPGVLFSKDAGAFVEENHQLPIDVLGVDWRVDLAMIRAKFNGRGPRAYQGNLDPITLLGRKEILLEKARRILHENASTPGFIFNLGHGVVPATPVENVRALTDFVHDFRRTR
jgi:uroporphyrinogen decarboxylase